MALESCANNNVVSQLCADVSLPRMQKLQQKFDTQHLPLDDIASIVNEELKKVASVSPIRAGMSVAITCGSRGVANIAIITKAIVDFVKECGGFPFVFPAMGSHGGATSHGQLEVLASYGVTEQFLGCPIRATMETVQVGKTSEGIAVFMDRYAYEADAIILCGRIKAHTAFHGPIESGLIKMAVIGMGKQHGAENIHEPGFSNMARILPQAGDVLLQTGKIICGIGILENAFDQTYKINAIPAADIPVLEPTLLLEAKKMMGKIHFSETDVLVVDRIGKDISGDGMDPNISGTFGSSECSGGINAQRVVVLDLTEDTHGNANGIGTASITTKRLVDKIDVDTTYPNAVTSTLLCEVSVPIFTHTDKQAIQLGIRTCNMIDKNNPRIIRIRDTLNIEYIYVSEALIEEAMKNPNLKLIGEPEDWDFNADGNLW